MIYVFKNKNAKIFYEKDLDILKIDWQMLWIPFHPI